jgi:exopolysaccharide biosynthesis protein
MTQNSVAENRDLEKCSMGKKKRNSLRMFMIFLAFEFVFTAVSFTLIVFYGPFQKVKNMIVTTAMATFKHQYIAKAFLSDNQIANIMENEAEGLKDGSNNETQNINNIKVVNKDNGVEHIEIKGRKFSGHALVIHNPLKVKVGYSSKLGVEGETTSEIAKRHNAVAAINGGGFQDISPNGKMFSGIGAVPVGIVMSEGKILYPKEEIKDSTSFGSMMALTKDGKLIVGGNYNYGQLKSLGVQEALSFIPTLIVNGKRNISDYSLQGANPRTAIGQREDGSIIFLTIDGRQGLQLGATLKDLQDVFLELNAYNAMCLDGGSSTTMYFNGEIINNPSNNMGERTIPTIVYVEQ